MTEITLTAVPADLINLPGDVFVAQAVERLRLVDVSPRERHALAQAIYRGVNKSRIWESLSARSDGRAIASAPSLPGSLVRRDDEIAIEEVLLDHAPEDDAIFVEYVFCRLVGRDPELGERLRIQGALADGDMDRKSAVRAILRTSQAEGRAPTVAAMAGDQAFSLIFGERAERIVLAKRLSGREYLLAEGALRGGRLHDDGLELHGGLALAGPKRSLRGGVWRLKLDWVQDDEAAIAVDVTANGGADKLAGLTLTGPAACNVEFRVLPEHLVSEVLVHGVRKGAAERWLVQPREVSLQWVGE